MHPAACDLLIIGSGFGGSVCACRAAAAGMQVVVLERGPRATDDHYERIARGYEPLLDRPFAPALVSPARVSGVLSLSGSAVGGTSHLYTAVTVPAPHEIFSSDWPASFDFESLRPHLERVQAMISPSSTPMQFGRTNLLARAAASMAAQATVLPLAMDWNESANSAHARQAPRTAREQFVDWLQGGAIGRKRTLDQTYLAAAEAAGARILPLHEVVAIMPHDGGYRVDAIRYDDVHSPRISLAARRVVIAAGTLGTLRLLFRCRDELHSLPNLSSALGRRFFTNGDFGGLLLVRRDLVSADAGPPVTAWIDLWSSDRIFLMETGIVPVLQPMLVAATGGLSQRLTRSAWSFAVMGFDANAGTIRLTRRGRLTCKFDHISGGSFHRARVMRLRELAAAIGGTLLIPPTWFADRFPVTVHPLGGAALADNPGMGVTNRFGEVFGHPGLYIADGSLLPTPTGVAPSMTIAALAEHVAASLIDTGKC